MSEFGKRKVEDACELDDRLSVASGRCYILLSSFGVWPGKIQNLVTESQGKIREFQIQKLARTLNYYSFVLIVRQKLFGKIFCGCHKSILASIRMPS